MADTTYFLPPEIWKEVFRFLLYVDEDHTNEPLYSPEINSKIWANLRSVNREWQRLADDFFDFKMSGVSGDVTP